MATNIISVMNHKGGVGKTTTSVNIGFGLANAGKKVLLIDLDPQANLSQSLKEQDKEKTIYGALRGEYALPIYAKGNLDIVVSTLDLSAAEIELSSEAGREFLLRELIDPIKTNYDYIIIDCPPSLGLLTLNALSSSTGIIIPVQSEYLAIQGMTKLLGVVAKVQQRLNKKLNITGMLITQYDSRTVLNRNIADTIKAHYNNQVFDTYIRKNISLAEAPAVGQDIFSYAPKSIGAEDYQHLVDEILKN